MHVAAYSYRSWKVFWRSVGRFERVTVKLIAMIDPHWIWIERPQKISVASKQITLEEVNVHSFSTIDGIS